MVSLPEEENTPEKRVNKIFDLMDKVINLSYTKNHLSCVIYHVPCTIYHIPFTIYITMHIPYHTSSCSFVTNIRDLKIAVSGKPKILRV